MKKKLEPIGEVTSKTNFFMNFSDEETKANVIPTGKTSSSIDGPCSPKTLKLAPIEELEAELTEDIVFTPR
jgi:hypothetical protein